MNINLKTLTSAITGSNYRYLEPYDETFAIKYYNVKSASFELAGERSVVKNKIGYRVIGHHHSLQNEWDAPLFYEDSRHVFYVTTAEKPVWIRDYSEFGTLVGLGPTQVMAIPPLVLQMDPKVQSKPKPWNDGAPIVINPGVVDPAPMERYVTEDAYIRQGIGTIGRVAFGDKQIGPSGAIRDVRE